MVTLGRRVIEKACAQTVRWAATREGRPMRMWSRDAIADRRRAVVEDLLAALELAGASGQQLALELGEQALAAISPEVFKALATRASG